MKVLGSRNNHSGPSNSRPSGSGRGNSGPAHRQHSGVSRDSGRVRRSEGKKKPPPPVSAEQVLRRRRPIPLIVAGGIVVTFLVFAFLAFLQPVLSSSERLRLDSSLSLQFKVEAPKRPPKPKREPPAQREEARPQERPRQRQRQTQKLQRRPEQTRALEAPQIAASNVAGMNLSPSLGGGSGVLINFSDAATRGFMDQYQEFKEYEDRRERIREGGFQRGRPGAGMSGITIPKPVLKDQPKPRYPERARKLGLIGRVKIRVLVSVEGKVIDSEIVAADPAGYFEEAILEVLPRWQLPAAEDATGRPIEHEQEFTYVFRLEDA